MNELYDYIPEQYSLEHLLDNLEFQLFGEPNAELRLILEIIKSAKEDNDLDYFLGDTFKYHCFLIGLDSKEISDVIIRKNLLTPQRKSVYTRRKPGDSREAIIYKRNVEGLSVQQIANEYDICPKTVRKLLNPNYSPRQVFHGNKENIIRDYSNGMSVTSIGEKYKMSSTSVYRALGKLDKR